MRETTTANPPCQHEPTDSLVSEASNLTERELSDILRFQSSFHPSITPATIQWEWENFGAILDDGTFIGRMYINL